MSTQSSTLSKVLIVAALAIAAGAVLYMKQQPSTESKSAPGAVEAAIESPSETASPLPRLVDLGSDKCQSCLAMVPVLDALTKEYDGRLQVDFIDVWKEVEEAVRYEIQLIPTQIFFEPGGKELFRHEGFFSKKDILAKWKDLGYEFDG